MYSMHLANQQSGMLQLDLGQIHSLRRRVLSTTIARTVSINVPQEKEFGIALSKEVMLPPHHCIAAAILLCVFKVQDTRCEM